MVCENSCSSRNRRRSTTIHQRCRKMKKLLTEKISSNQLFSNFFCKKDVTFTKVLPEMCVSKLQQFSHCVCTTNQEQQNSKFEIAVAALNVIVFPCASVHLIDLIFYVKETCVIRSYPKVLELQLLPTNGKMNIQIKQQAHVDVNFGVEVVLSAILQTMQ